MIQQMMDETPAEVSKYVTLAYILITLFAIT
jgi:hypothetical protein